MIGLLGIESKVARCVANGVLAVGSVIGGWWAFESRLNGRYVLAAEFVQQQKEIRSELKDLREGQLLAHQAILRRELFDIEQEATRGVISPALAQRREHLVNELARVNAKLTRVNEK